MSQEGDKAFINENNLLRQSNSFSEKSVFLFLNLLQSTFHKHLLENRLLYMYLSRL